MGCGAINWCGFSWEAFASLLTGILAVGAAWWVGRKQTQIQTQALKSDLFDRRLENYETVRDLVHAMLANPAEFDPILLNKFFTAKRQAYFLFSSRVNRGLDEIYDLCGNLNALQLQILSETALNGHSGSQLPQEKHEAFLALSARYRALPRLYDEMRLDGF